MAFSQGQMYFALFFLIVFIVGVTFAYRSDLKRLSSSKKDARNVLIFIIIVMASFFGIIKFLSA